MNRSTQGSNDGVCCIASVGAILIELIFLFDSKNLTRVSIFFLIRINFIKIFYNVLNILLFSLCFCNIDLRWTSHSVFIVELSKLHSTLKRTLFVL